MCFCPKLMVPEKIMTSLILAAVNLYENIISDYKLKVILNPSNGEIQVLDGCR